MVPETVGGLEVLRGKNHQAATAKARTTPAMATFFNTRGDHSNAKRGLQ
jgi:hypothetical protein